MKNSYLFSWALQIYTIYILIAINYDVVIFLLLLVYKYLL